jgi:hypothetical protein
MPLLGESKYAKTVDRPVMVVGGKSLRACRTLPVLAFIAFAVWAAPAGAGNGNGNGKGNGNAAPPAAEQHAEPGNGNANGHDKEPENANGNANGHEDEIVEPLTDPPVVDDVPSVDPAPEPFEDELPTNEQPDPIQNAADENASPSPDPAEIGDENELATGDQPEPNDDFADVNETSSVEAVVPELPSVVHVVSAPEPAPVAAQPEASQLELPLEEPALQSPAPIESSTGSAQPNETRGQEALRRRMPSGSGVTVVRNVNGVARVKAASASYVRVSLRGRTPHRLPR